MYTQGSKKEPWESEPITVCGLCPHAVESRAKPLVGGQGKPFAPEAGSILKSRGLTFALNYRGHILEHDQLWYRPNNSVLSCVTNFLF